MPTFHIPLLLLEQLQIVVAYLLPKLPIHPPSAKKNNSWSQFEETERKGKLKRSKKKKKEKKKEKKHTLILA